MSSLQQDDERFHYSDNSHRWIAPTEEEQDGWETMVRNHMDEHRRNPDAGVSVHRRQVLISTTASQRARAKR